MTDADRTDYLDPAHTVHLCDVGQRDYLAAVAVGSDGEQRLILAHRASVGDDNVCYDATCSAVAHEQLGELSIEYVRRIAIAARTHRCGRRTKAGRACRLRVEAPGQACGFHDDDRTRHD